MFKNILLGKRDRKRIKSEPRMCWEELKKDWRK
jgi:hypothetical protein